MGPQERWAAFRERYPDVFICSVPVCEFSLAESLTMHAVQSSGRVTQPARSFCDTYITARTAGNEIAPNPPFTIRHYFLHLHYHGSQALGICCARYCAFLFPVREYGPLNLGRDARSTLDSQWTRAWISIPSPIPCLLATFGPVIFLDTTERSLNGLNIPRPHDETFTPAFSVDCPSEAGAARHHSSPALLLSRYQPRALACCLA